jgi:hypothetical protein
MINENARRPLWAAGVPETVVWPKGSSYEARAARRGADAAVARADGAPARGAALVILEILARAAVGYGLRSFARVRGKWDDYK